MTLKALVSNITEEKKARGVTRTVHSVQDKLS